MNGFINPIRNLLKKVVEPTPAPAPPAKQNETNEPSVAREHSPEVAAPYDDIDDEEDYYVYKIDFQDNKAPDWKLEKPRQRPRDAYFGAQVSDTVKNSYIHVFPDRQDLVNPPIGLQERFRNAEVPKHYYPHNYYGVENNNIQFPEQKHRVLTRSPTKSQRGNTKILPTSILDDSPLQSIDMMDRINSPERPERNNFRTSSNILQAYSGVPPQPSKLSHPNPKRNMEDYSMIAMNKKEATINLDDSDDVNVALVIQALEKNIARSEAARQNKKRNSWLTFGRTMKRQSSGRYQENDTLSLENSTAKVEQPMYTEEPRDLRSRLLGNVIDSNRTIYYSFDKQDSISYSDRVNSEASPVISKVKLLNLKEIKRPSIIETYVNKTPTQTIIDPISGKKKPSPPRLQLARIDEECSSVKTVFREGVFGTNEDFRMNEGRISSRNIDNSKLARFPSTILKTDGPSPHHSKTRFQSQQFIMNTQPAEPNVNKKGHQPKSKSIIPKLQFSDNFILCINCNDLLPANSVDKHSIYCNESMMAPEEISRELVLDSSKPRLSLEKCNFRLGFIKTLLEKNLKNLRGQLEFKLITIDEAEAVFSELTLAIKLIGEATRNDSIISKLSLDINSLKNLNEDLGPYMDVTLVNIIMMNLKLAADFCRQKQKALDLVARQSQTIESSGRIYDDTKEVSPNLTIKTLHVPKAEHDRGKNFSLASPQSNLSKHPTHPSNYSHSSRGSTLTSNRAIGEHRHALSGDLRNFLGWSK